eukprot:7039468-Pyramimonas_sp.AAC.1
MRPCGQLGGAIKGPVVSRSNAGGTGFKRLGLLGEAPSPTSSGSDSAAMCTGAGSVLDDDRQLTTRSPCFCA